MPAMAIEWVGTKEACTRLGVNLRTLYRFIDSGALPAYKMGRVIRMKAEDLDVFLDSVKVEPGALAHLYPDPTSPD